MKAKAPIKRNHAMATKQSKLGKTPPLNPELVSQNYEVDYFHFFQSLYRKEITDWQAARNARYDPFNPITYPLQQCYRDAMLDNHLYGAIENRILRVINKQYLIKDSSGTPDPDRSAYLRRHWFKHLVRKAMESKFYGYSMVLISEADRQNIKITDIPRENVIPERRIIVRNAFDPNSESIAFDQYPYHIIYIQLLPNAIGLLERIAPLTILKRHSWAAWDEFEQVFGVPIRIARTMIDTQKHRDDLQHWLENMGVLSYGIFDKRVDLEIKENNKSDSFNVFAKKIELVNKEISKAVLGQTMSMDDGSSYSQASVHLDTLIEVTNADIADIEGWVNHELLPVMREWGYDIPEGYYLDIVANASLDPLERIKVDEVLMRNGWNLDKDYIERTYEVKLDPQQPKVETPQPATLSLTGEHDFFA